MSFTDATPTTAILFPIYTSQADMKDAYVVNYGLPDVSGVLQLQ